MSSLQIDLQDVFVRVPKTFELQIENKTNLMTSFEWDIQVNDNYTVVITPDCGRLDANETVTCSFRVVGHRPCVLSAVLQLSF